MFRALALCHRFDGGQFTLSSQLMILSYPVILSHRRNTTVSLESYPPDSFLGQVGLASTNKLKYYSFFGIGTRAPNARGLQMSTGGFFGEPPWKARGIWG